MKVSEEVKVKVKKFLIKFSNLLIVVATLVAGFGTGYYFHELKTTKQIIPTTNLQDASPAIDYQGNLLLDGKKYSDTTLKVITRMGVKHLYQ